MLRCDAIQFLPMQTQHNAISHANFIISKIRNFAVWYAQHISQKQQTQVESVTTKPSLKQYHRFIPKLCCL